MRDKPAGRASRSGTCAARAALRLCRTKKAANVAYGPGDLDILSQAFYGALDSRARSADDPEEIKAILMTGILDAARSGERDPERLQAAGENALLLYEGGRTDAAVRSAL